MQNYGTKSVLLTGMAEDAYKFGLEAHKNQRRRGNEEPYFNHCMRVAEDFLKYNYGNYNTGDGYCAALLHDVIEDCGVTSDMLLAKGFSQRTVELVLGMTRHPFESKDYYMARIIASGDVELMLLKLCDTRDNMTINPFNLKGFTDWRASYDRYSKNYILLIKAIDKATYQQALENSL